MAQSFRINNGLAISVIAVLLTAAISFNAWAVAALYERPTEDKTVELIQVHSPYAEDRKLILQSLKRIETLIEKLHNGTQ